MQVRHSLLLTAAALAGCAVRERIVEVPVVVTREVLVVRPLPEPLLTTGPAEESTSLRECPAVARDRLKDLRSCYNRLFEIKKIQAETTDEEGTKQGEG